MRGHLSEPDLVDEVVTDVREEEDDKSAQNGHSNCSDHDRGNIEGPLATDLTQLGELLLPKITAASQSLEAAIGDPLDLPLAEWLGRPKHMEGWTAQKKLAQVHAPEWKEPGRTVAQLGAARD